MSKIYPLFTMRFTLCSKRGFTLIEIMLALAIMGGLLITLLYSLNYHLGIAERHRTITVASMLAKSKLLETEKNPTSTKGNFPGPYTRYHYTTEVKNSPYPGIIEFSVTVVNGKESVTFSELMGRLK